MVGTMSAGLKIGVGLLKGVIRRTGGRVTDDLVQAAHEGVARASKTFDPERGRFTPYAAGWARHTVQRAMAENRTIRLPRFRKPERPSSLPPLSLDAPAEHADAHDLHDSTPGLAVAPDQGAMAGELADAVGDLPEKERAAIVALFCEGMTNEEAARSLGISEETLRKRKNAALLRLFERLA